MLQVNVLQRLDCQQLLKMIDKFRPNLDTQMDSWDELEPLEQNDKMLETIMLPRDLRMLDRKLPRSNYADNRREKSANPPENRYSLA